MFSPYRRHEYSPRPPIDAAIFGAEAGFKFPPEKERGISRSPGHFSIFSSGFHPCMERGRFQDQP